MTDGGVAELAAQARAAGRLGIDTEFMGEGRYRALLCLAQIAVETPDGLRVEVLDPLTEDYDPAPLAAVLADPQVQVVVHAGRQDVALLRREWATDVNAIFDTQVAAGFAGLRAQLGYEALLHEMGHPPAQRGADRVRARGRPAPARAHRRPPAGAARTRAARLGDRGVPRARGRLRRARARRDLQPPAADQLARARPARRRSRARSLARGGRARVR